MWWCPKHKCPKETYDGIYVGHPPDEHDKWQTRKDKFKANRKDKGDYKTETSYNDSKENLSN